MKNRILLLFILCRSFTTYSQVLTVGEKMPDMTLAYSLQGKAIKTSSVKGKILLIDFWATWCSPCVKELNHLEEMKQSLGNRLEVLAISEEPEDRLRKFVKERPSTLTFGRDTTGSLRKYFPYKIIPHTVLIGPDGKVYAITDPTKITTGVLKTVLKKIPVDLPRKNDLIDFNVNNYFKVDSTKSRHFSLLPAVPGVASMSNMPGEGPYKQRRITIVNQTMDGLFRIVYSKSYFSTLNEYDTTKRSWDQEEKFCLDAWIEVPDRSQLMHFMQEELNKHFVDVQATIEKRNRKVLVLQSKDAGKSLKPSEDKKQDYNAGSDHFAGSGVTLDQLAEWIENFGIYNGTVVNETGIKGEYNIDIKFQPEKRDSFQEALAQLGLYSFEAERQVDMLVLKKK